MKNLFRALLFALLPCVSFAQQISERARMSLLTGSPGTELYSTFGHSAIRVIDPQHDLDIVFNYGTFDFNTQNFYIKFARGKLLYKLSIQSFENFQNSFRYENRSVLEQELNLSVSQKKKLYRLLHENYQPENRYYKYDFFFDNCATRIRDMVVVAFGDEFSYQYPEKWQKSELTFRNLIDLYLTDHHWSDFGIDLALGMPTDNIATPADYMFLPDYLAEGFQTARIERDGKWQPFILSEEIIVERVDLRAETFLITPSRLMWLIFAIAIILSFHDIRKKKRIHSWFDTGFFTLIGLVGWVVFLLWFFTDHIATKSNLNLLWAFPLHLPVFLGWNWLGWSFRSRYIYILGIVCALILLLWAVFPQQYHVAFIPVILTMLVRYLVILYA